MEDFFQQLGLCSYSQGPADVRATSVVCAMPLTPSSPPAPRLSQPLTTHAGPRCDQGGPLQPRVTAQEPARHATPPEVGPERVDGPTAAPCNGRPCVLVTLRVWVCWALERCRQTQTHLNSRPDRAPALRWRRCSSALQAAAGGASDSLRATVSRGTPPRRSTPSPPHAPPAAGSL